MIRKLSLLRKKKKKKNGMGIIDYDDEGWPTLCVQINEQDDIDQVIRIFKGEESLGVVRCIQLCVFFFVVIDGFTMDA